MKKRMDLENYVRVNDRIEQFRKDYSDGFIHTVREPDLILEDGTVFVRFQAFVFRSLAEVEMFGKSNIAAATGHAELVLEDNKVTEKCETIAIGRALAILGYKVETSIASREEMEAFVASEPEDEEAELAPSRKSRFESRIATTKPRLAASDLGSSSEEEEEEEQIPDNPRAKRQSSFRSRR